MLRSSSKRFRCLDFQEASFRSNAFSCLTFCDRRPFRQVSSTSRSANGKPWLSLDGLLVNPEAEISTARNEKLERRAANMESFLWLHQRILAVMVVGATAAAATKERYLKQINRLQQAVDNRDKESARLQRQMEHIKEQLFFWKEHARVLSGGAQSHYMKAVENLDSNETLPQVRYALEERTPKCDSKILGQLATPQWGEGLRKKYGSIGSCKDKAFDQRYTTESEIMFVQSGGNVGSFRRSCFDDEDADQKAEFVSDCSSFAQDNLEVLTPCLPFTELKKLYTPHTSLNTVSSRQGGPYCQNVGKRLNSGLDLQACHAPGAGVVLKVKDQLQQILHSEASAVFTAFASVIEKARILESANGSAMLNQPLNTCLQTAVKDLKESIEQAALRVTSLEQVVLNVWPGLGPEALATLHVSLTDVDASYSNFVKDQPDVLTSSSAQAWKQCLDQNVEAQIMTNECLWRRTDAEERRLSGMSDWSIDTSTTDLSCTDQHQGVGPNVASAIQCAVKKTVDNFMAPWDERAQTGEVGKCPEMVIEQLLSELENAAAKVAGMEVQMKILRDSLSSSERKRRKAEQNLAKAQQNSLNQVSINLDMIDRSEQLQSKQSTLEDSIAGQQLVDKWCEASHIVSEDLTSVRDAERTLAVLKDACRVKDNMIVRLEEEIAELQNKISDLKLQTPNAMSQRNQFSQPTLVASNLLFNLDSPFKVESPQNTLVASNLLFNLDSPFKVESPQNASNSLWRGLDELSTVSDSLDKEQTGRDNDTCTTWNQKLNKEPGCFPPEKVKQSVKNTEENGNGFIQLMKPKVAATSHARKLKFSSMDSRFSEDKKRRSFSEGVNRVGRKEGNLRTSLNVLAGVEPNTPHRVRKFGMNEREQRNINRAKENFSKQRRWM